MVALARAEIIELAAAVSAREHLHHPGAHGLLQGRREIPESERVDHVAAPVLEEAVEQLQILQGAAIGRLWSSSGEGDRECLIALDPSFRQGGLVFEKESFDDIISAMVNDAACGTCGFFLHRLA